MFLRYNHKDHAEVRIMHAKANPNFEYIRSWLNLRYSRSGKQLSPEEIIASPAFQKYVPEPLKEDFSQLIRQPERFIFTASFLIDQLLSSRMVSDAKHFFFDIACADPESYQQLYDRVIKCGSDFYGRTEFFQKIDMIKSFLIFGENNTDEIELNGDSLKDTLNELNPIMNASEKSPGMQIPDNLIQPVGRVKTPDEVPEESYLSKLGGLDIILPSTGFACDCLTEVCKEDFTDFDDLQNKILYVCGVRLQEYPHHFFTDGKPDYEKVESFVGGILDFLKYFASRQYGHEQFVITDIVHFSELNAAISIPKFLPEPHSESYNVPTSQYLKEMCSFGVKSEREELPAQSLGDVPEPDEITKETPPNASQEEKKVVVQIPFGNLQLVAQSLSGEALAVFVKHLLS